LNSRSDGVDLEFPGGEVDDEFTLVELEGHNRYFSTS
jgi:hypothetical protein